jgi:hypothetical protein
MTTTTNEAGALGAYSIVQFCPDRGRAEVANIGVVLHAPSTGILQAQLSRGNDNPRRIFKLSGQSLEQLNAMKESFAARIASEQRWIVRPSDFADFAGRWSNDLIMTEPRSIRIIDPQTCLSHLFAEYVGGRTATTRTPWEPAGLQALYRALLSSEFAGRIRVNERFAVRNFASPLHIDFTFQNGSLNLLKAETFDARSEEPNTRRMSELAIRGDTLRRQRSENGEQTTLVLFPFYAEECDAGTPDHVEGIARDYHFNVVREPALGEYIETVKAQLRH